MPRTALEVRLAVLRLSIRHTQVRPRRRQHSVYLAQDGFNVFEGGVAALGEEREYHEGVKSGLVEHHVKAPRVERHLPRVHREDYLSEGGYRRR